MLFIFFAIYKNGIYFPSDNEIKSQKIKMLTAIIETNLCTLVTQTVYQTLVEQKNDKS